MIDFQSDAYPTDDLNFLTVLPVYNEAAHVDRVLDSVVKHAGDILVVDDGSTDGTAALLAKRTDVKVVTHEHNLGYGAALRSGFACAIKSGYDVVVTIDCDGQHEPQRIQQLAAACRDFDLVSGSRYLEAPPAGARQPPEDRLRINRTITAELNSLLDLDLTDAFCGFKAYRIDALQQLRLTEPGYAMPLELWVQAADQGLSITEIAVPLIYLEEERSFGAALDNAEQRLAYYRRIIEKAQRLAAEVTREENIAEWSRHRCPKSVAQ